EPCHGHQSPAKSGLHFREVGSISVRVLLFRVSLMLERRDPPILLLDGVLEVLLLLLMIGIVDAEPLSLKIQYLRSHHQWERQIVHVRLPECALTVEFGLETFSLCPHLGKLCP